MQICCLNSDLCLDFHKPDRKSCDFIHIAVPLDSPLVLSTAQGTVHGPFSSPFCAHHNITR